jgi:hypothetical protein
MQIAFRHPEYDITGATRAIDGVPYSAIWAAMHSNNWAAQDYHRQWASKARFDAVAVRGRLFVQQQPRFRAIDAMPQFIEPSEVSLEDLVHFVPHARRELFLPEPEVDELLEKILARQIPVQQALAMERARKRVAAKIIGVAA